jgi:hypothetical protein
MSNTTRFLLQSGEDGQQQKPAMKSNDPHCANAPGMREKQARSLFRLPSTGSKLTSWNGLPLVTDLSPFALIPSSLIFPSFSGVPPSDERQETRLRLCCNPQGKLREKGSAKTAMADFAEAMHRAGA